MAKPALFSDGRKKGVSTLPETQKVNAVRRFVDQSVASVWFHKSTFPAEAEPRTKMEIKSVTLEKCCENMPRQTCFEKPRSCWYGCLCLWSWYNDFPCDSEM